MRKLIFSLMLLFGSYEVSSQTRPAVNGAAIRVETVKVCGFNIMSGFGVRSLENNAQAINLVHQVLVVAGMDPSRIFLAPSTEVNSSIALACENDEGGGAIKRYIIYSPDVLNSLAQDSQNNWFITGIFAHEVGHLKLNHSLLLRKPTDCDSGGVTDKVNGTLRRDMETAADEFAGKLLAKLGAPLADAQSTFARISNDVGDECYPSKADRMAAVKRGWVSAGELEIVKVYGENMVVPPGGFKEFSVRVVNSEGRPVPGVKVAWQTEEDGIYTYVGLTDDNGISSATNMYSHSSGRFTQKAFIADKDTALGFFKNGGVVAVGPAVRFNFNFQ